MFSQKLENPNKAKTKNPTDTEITTHFQIKMNLHIHLGFVLIKGVVLFNLRSGVSLKDSLFLTFLPLGLRCNSWIA